MTGKSFLANRFEPRSSKNEFLAATSSSSTSRKTLKDTNLEIQGKQVALSELFQALANELAKGSVSGRIKSRIRGYLGINDNQMSFDSRSDGWHESDVLGPLVILGLVKVQPPHGEWYELFYLTDLGRDVLHELSDQSTHLK